MGIDERHTALHRFDMSHTTNMTPGAKFTSAQLDQLAAEYAMAPARLSDENIEKLRVMVTKFSDVALAQVIFHEPGIKWVRVLAATEARVRNLGAAADLRKLIA